MKKRQQLPNLCKGIQRLIGHIDNDNKKYSDLDFKENSDIFYRKIVNEDGIVTITHENHKEFVELIKKIKIVFDAENVKYNSDQIGERLSKFVLQTIEEFLSRETKRIEAFIEKLKVPKYTEYFFRLSNFEYDHQISLGKYIKTVKGKEILDRIPRRLNKNVEENSKHKNIIQPDDILLGISVIAPEHGYQGYYKAFDVATRVNNLINFLNGFNHKPSQVLELNKYINQENNLYQFKYKNGHFFVKQTPGAFDSNWKWSILKKRHPDNRTNANLNVDDRWLDIIPSIIENDDKLSALQKQCARAIDWIGDGIVNSNLTKQFLQIMISLETMLEQDPDELKSRLKKDKLWNDELSVSIDNQLVSTMYLIFYLKTEDNQSKLKTSYIKKAYKFRSEIAHNGKQLTEDDTSLVKNWYDIAYKIIANIMFLGNWDSTYDLWKAANLSNKDSDEN